LSGITGLSFTTGDGTADTTMNFTGLITDIKAALQGMHFIPTTNFTGNASLTITTDDQDAGGALSDTDTVTIIVTEFNQPPTNNVPGAQSVNEDTNLVFAGNLSVNDPDAPVNPIRVSLSVNSGVLTLSTTSGLSFTAGDGTADAA